MIVGSDRIKTAAATVLETEMDKLAGVIASVSQTSTPATGSNTTQFTFKDAAGTALAFRASGLCYLSSDSAGATPVAAVTSAAAATNGALTAVDAGKKIWQFIAKTDGTLGITLTSTAGSYYWNFILPSGRVVTSTVITIN